MSYSPLSFFPAWVGDDDCLTSGRFGLCDLRHERSPLNRKAPFRFVSSVCVQRAALSTSTPPSRCAVGIEVRGYQELVDLPKLGPSLLIASELILAIRTAKYPADYDARRSNKNW